MRLNRICLCCLMLLKAKPRKGQHDHRKESIQYSPYGKYVQDKLAKLIGDIFSDLRHGGPIGEQEQSQIVCASRSVG